MKLNISKYKLNIDKIEISKKRRVEWFRWEDVLNTYRINLRTNLEESLFNKYIDNNNIEVYEEYDNGEWEYTEHICSIWTNDTLIFVAFFQGSDMDNLQDILIFNKEKMQEILDAAYNINKPIAELSNEDLIEK